MRKLLFILPFLLLGCGGGDDICSDPIQKITYQLTEKSTTWKIDESKGSKDSYNREIWLLHEPSGVVIKRHQYRVSSFDEWKLKWDVRKPAYLELSQVEIDAIEESYTIQKENINDINRCKISNAIKGERKKKK